MSLEALKQHIHSALETLKAEEERTEWKYKNIWHSGMGTFDMLQNLERIRNKRVELETTLKIIAEYE